MDRAIRQEYGHLQPEVVRHLVQTDGSAHPCMLPSLDSNSAWGQVIPNGETTQAEVIHAVREEMAEELVDIVLRRTGVGTLGNPGYEPLRICGQLMAEALGWNESHTADELRTVIDAYVIQMTPEAKRAVGRSCQHYVPVVIAVLNEAENV
jgi:glycerol-3-phosphate dehydrogenase